MNCGKAGAVALAFFLLLINGICSDPGARFLLALV